MSNPRPYDCESNALVYLASSSVTKKKSFITLTPEHVPDGSANPVEVVGHVPADLVGKESCAQCYKTFYVRNLRFFVKSKSVGS